MADLLFDLKLQIKLISTVILPRFPQMRCFSISDYVVWNKFEEDEAWKPSLHLVPLLEVAERLRRGNVNFVDYDGFLKRILSTAEYSATGHLPNRSVSSWKGFRSFFSFFSEGNR